MDQSSIAHFLYELRNPPVPLSQTPDQRKPSDDLNKLVQILETTTGQQLGPSENFLFLTVNQSTITSTCNHIVLNIGFNDEVAQKLALVTDPLYVYQCYCLFIETYSFVVFGVSPQDLSDVAEEIGLAGSEKLDVTKLKMLINGYQNLLQFLNHVIPQDPREQLSLYVQKVSEKLPTDPIQLKVQCLLINDIHQRALTIEPSTKSFVTCEHGFDQNDALVQSIHGTTSDGQKLDRITKDLNAKAESSEDVVLFLNADAIEYRSSPFAQFKKTFKGKRDTGIAAAATCLILVILGVLLFLLLRSSTSKTFLVFGTVTGDSVALPGVLVSGDGLDDVYTTEDGFFRLQPLANGDYELSFELVGYVLKSVSVTVSDNDKTVDVSLSLHTFVVSGTITSDSVELADVLVSGDGFDDVYSNAEGYFELEPLINGIYELTFELAGYDSKSVNVTVSGSDESIDVSLDLPSLQLYIYDDLTSEPIPNPSVKLNQDLIVDGDEDGYVIIADLIPGDYELILMHSDYYNRTLHVEVQFSKIQSLSLTRHGFTIVGATITAYDASVGISVSIPAYVNGVEITGIGPYAFAFKNLIAVSFADNIYSIGMFAFAGNNIDSLHFGNGLTIIGQDAFSTNYELTTVVFGNSLTTIGSNAFTYTSISSIVIPDSVTTIHFTAFYYSNLSSVILSESLTEISKGVFIGNELTSITIPSSVTKIGDSAFQNNKLSSVEFGNSVQLIDVQAFYHNLLESLKFPDSLERINSEAFANNPLLSVEIGDDVTSLDDSAIPGNFKSEYIQTGAGVYSRSSTSDDFAFED
ncbi:hypothetical protein GEMRC1_007946 [Eukaryota sp. GEM-RC1]